MNGSTMRSRKQLKDTLQQMKMVDSNPKSVGHSKKNPEREIHSIRGLSQKNKEKLK